MDKRRFNGGHSNGGRKSKSEEQKLIENLTPLKDKALSALEDALDKGHSWAVKLYFEYYFGKSKNLEVESQKQVEQPLFSYSDLSDSALREIANLE